MTRSHSLKLASLATYFLAVFSWLTPESSFAFPSFLTDWQTRYPGSLSDDNVGGSGCALCHGSDTVAAGSATWNGYGWALRQETQGGTAIADAFALVEALNSDGDPDSVSDLDEINANTQPGWTEGANNTIFMADGSSASNQSAPGGIGALDPAAAGDCNLQAGPSPTVFGIVEVGETEARTVVLSNTGNADCEISSLSLAGSANFALGAGAPAGSFSISAGGSEDIPVDYAPNAVTLSEAGTLTVASNDPDEPSISVDLEGAATVTLPPVVVEYDLRNGTLIQDTGFAYGDPANAPGSATDKFFSNDISVMAAPFIDVGYTQPIEVHFVDSTDPCENLGSVDQRIELVHLIGFPFPESFNTEEVVVGPGNHNVHGPGLIVGESAAAYTSASADLSVSLLDPIIVPNGEITEFETACVLSNGRCESASLDPSSDPPHNPDLTDNQISFGGFTMTVRNTAPIGLTADFIQFNLIAGGEINVDSGVTDVAIDIKPGTSKNPINPGRSDAVSVVILSSSSFDALSVDPETVCLLGAGVKETRKGLLCREKDANHDDLVDLVCKMSGKDFVVDPGEDFGLLVGETFGGARINGEDAITIVP